MTKRTHGVPHTERSGVSDEVGQRESQQNGDVKHRERNNKRKHKCLCLKKISSGIVWALETLFYK